VQTLLEANINSDKTITRTLIDSLVCASGNVQNKLGIAAKASEYVRNSLDEHVIQLILSITNQEQVKLAENVVQDKQHALNAAEHDRHEA